MQRNKFNGEQLRYVRLLRGLNLTDVANNTNISKQSLSLYENGKNVPELENVMNLSDFLNVPYGFFFKENTNNVTTQTTYFRALLSANKKERVAQSIKIEFLTQIYFFLRQYADFPEVNLPILDFNSSNTISNYYMNQNNEEQIEDIAVNVRKYWGLKNNPIKDLKYLLEDNGIIVTSLNVAGEKIDAFSQKNLINECELIFIVISRFGQTTVRANFDMAHELAHILLHPWSEDLESIPKDEFKLLEQQANMFAGAFLLPKDSFGEQISRYPTNFDYYKYLKKEWNVSIKAMIYRAHQLKIISTNQYQYLMKQYSKSGWNSGEPGDTPYIQKDNMLKTAINLLIDGKILSSDIMLNKLEEMGRNLYPEEIEDLLHLKQGTLEKKEFTSSDFIRLKPNK